MARPPRIDLPPLGQSNLPAPSQRDLRTQQDRKRKQSVGQLESQDQSILIDLTEDTLALSVTLGQLTGYGASGGLIQSNGSAWVRVSVLSYSNLPTGGGTWALGGNLSLSGGLVTVLGSTSATSPLATVEQGSTGDAAVSWLLTAGQQYTAGIDNSISGDPWVLAASGALGTSNLLTFAADGHFAFGGGLVGQRQFIIRGTYQATAGAEAAIVDVATTIGVATAQNGYGLLFRGNFNRANNTGGTHPLFASALFRGASISAVALDDPLTLGATVYIEAPTGLGIATTARSLHIATGNSYFGGHVHFLDATYDLGDSATTFRPRDGFFSRNVQVGGTLVVVGQTTLATSLTGVLRADAGVVSIAAGVGAKSLFDHYADQNNGTTVETDLYSDTVAAGQLAANGEKISAQYAGVFTGDATSTQRVRAYFAGTLIFDSGALAILAVTDSWDLWITVIRESSSIVRCSAAFTSNFATLNASATYTRITGLTLSNTQVLKITGTAAGATGGSNQITAKEGYVQWIPAA